MTVVTIHQPNYLPWIGLFHKIMQADVYVSLDCVQFGKNSYTNRNSILGPQGPILLTVPVLTKGRFGCTISEVEINPHTRWAEKHLRSLEQAYRKAPYWEEHVAFFRSVYLERTWTRLVDLNEEIIRYLLGCLGAEVKFLRASQLKVQGESTDLLVAIAQAVGASVYMSGPSGKSYLDEEKFARAGIELRYHEFEHPKYSQGRRSEFVANLSAVDLVFHHGPASRAIVRGGASCQSDLGYSTPQQMA